MQMFFHMLRTPGEAPKQGRPDIRPENDTQDRESGPENYILCRQCAQVITSRHEKMSVNGSHRHTFANPHGIVFEIGCFRTVTGCGYAGSPSDEFSWFPGYRWRIVVCGMCLTHLGWLFMSAGGNTFHGLILDRLAE